MLRPRIPTFQPTNIVASWVSPEPLQVVELLIEGASGNIIGTRVGAPHLMGVEANGGKRYPALKAGLKNITITGMHPDGSTYTAKDLTCISAAEPAIFLHEFPG